MSDNRSDDNSIEEEFKDIPGLSEFVKSLPAYNTPPQKKKGSHIAGIVYNLLFYLIVLLIMAAAFFYSTSGGSAKSLFGYSYFTVLTTSMQSEIPKGSLVIVKQVDRDTIQVGDDITYIVDDNTTVTHRVTAIIENYEESGTRGFQTKGIENPEADREIVYATNVIGVVTFHVAGIGDALSYIGSNLRFIYTVFGLLIILSVSLRMFSTARTEEKQKMVKEKQKMLVEIKKGKYV